MSDYSGLYSNYTPTTFTESMPTLRRTVTPTWQDIYNNYQLQLYAEQLYINALLLKRLQEELEALLQLRYDDMMAAYQELAQLLQQALLAAAQQQLQATYDQQSSAYQQGYELALLAYQLQAYLQYLEDLALQQAEYILSMQGGASDEAQQDAWSSYASSSTQSVDEGDKTPEWLLSFNNWKDNSGTLGKVANFLIGDTTESLADVINDPSLGNIARLAGNALVDIGSWLIPAGWIGKGAKAAAAASKAAKAASTASKITTAAAPIVYKAGAVGIGQAVGSVVNGVMDGYQEAQELQLRDLLRQYYGEYADFIDIKHSGGKLIPRRR